METTSLVSDSHGLDMQAIYTALNRVQALIEFNLDGTIIHANENFLKTLGYTLDEVRGQHHAMFCDPDYTKTAAYKQFWTKLAAGEFERHHAHPDKVGPVDTFKAFGDHGLDAQKGRAFGRPVAR